METLYLDDGFGQRDVVLFDLQRLHPPFLLVLQNLTQLSGHLRLHRKEPAIKSNAPHTFQPQIICLW